MAARVNPPAKKAAPTSPTRRERAAETRARMIDAALGVFVERGYTGARMVDIAERAGVAVQTLYFTFHTKGELLRACYDRAVLGPEGIPPPLQPWWHHMLAADSGAEVIRRFVPDSAAITARAGLLDDVVRGALHEPDAVTVRAETERLRREGFEAVIDRIAEFGLALDRREATDLLLTLTGAAVYRSLVIDCGWSRERWEQWQIDTLTAVLIPSATSASPSRGQRRRATSP